MAAVVRQLADNEVRAAHTGHDPVMHQPGPGLHSETAFAGNAGRQRGRLMKAHVGQAGDRQPGQEQAGTFQQGLKGAAGRQPGRGRLYGIGAPPAVGGKRRDPRNGKTGRPPGTGWTWAGAAAADREKPAGKTPAFPAGAGRAARSPGAGHFPGPRSPFHSPRATARGPACHPVH